MPDCEDTVPNCKSLRIRCNSGEWTWVRGLGRDSATRSDIFCQWVFRFGASDLRSRLEKVSQQKKAEDFSSASFRLIPSPRYLPKTQLTAAGSASNRRC